MQGVALGVFGTAWLFVIFLDLSFTPPLVILAACDLMLWGFGIWIANSAYGQLRRDMDRGKCPQCRYDLRGTIHEESSACPECGASLP